MSNDPWAGFTGESGEERGYAEGWRDGRFDHDAELAAARSYIRRQAWAIILISIGTLTLLGWIAVTAVNR